MEDRNMKKRGIGFTAGFSEVGIDLLKRRRAPFSGALDRLFGKYE